MYQLEKIPFGELERINVWNEKSGNAFSFVPGFGGSLLDLQIGGKAIIEGCETPNELVANRWMKSALLAPFPNRLKEGTYEWNGKQYQFFVNDANTQNALHGFLMHQPMVLTQRELTKEQAVLSCAYTYDGNMKAYPFPFYCEVTYALYEPNRFELKLTFQNKGTTSLPIGLGWHPYIKIADGIDDLQFQMPAAEMIGVDEFMIPTGKRYEYNEFEQLKTISAAVLDNCFALKVSREQQVNLILKSDTHQLNYWQATGNQQFNYLQIFTHPDRTSIAIEPMSCNIDAFNNGDGLIALDPEEEISLSCGFSLDAINV